MTPVLPESVQANASYKHVVSARPLGSPSPERLGPECGSRGVLRQVGQEVRRPGPGEVHHLGLEIRPFWVIQVSPAGGVQTSPPRSVPSHPHLPGGRTGLGESGENRPLLGGPQGRGALSGASVSLDNATGPGILVFPPHLSAVITKPCDLFWGVCVCSLFYFQILI